MCKYNSWKCSSFLSKSKTEYCNPQINEARVRERFVKTSGPLIVRLQSGARLDVPITDHAKQLQNRPPGLSEAEGSEV